MNECKCPVPKEQQPTNEFIELSKSIIFSWPKSKKSLVLILIKFWVGAFALFIIISSASTNLVANYIPSQYSLINFIPTKLNLRNSSYIISLIGLLVAVFWLTILSQIGILSFIDTFGCFFGPLFGVIIVDYYVIKNENLSNKDLYSIENNSAYYYSGGWHLKGVYSVILGFIFSASTIWNVNLMFLQSYAWIIGAFISSITYYLLAKK